LWEYHRVSLYGWDLLLLALVAFSWRELWAELQRLAFSKSKLFLAYLLFVSLAFLAGSWARDSVVALYWSVRFVEAGALVFLILALKPTLTHALAALAATGTVQALWGLSQFAFQATFSSKWLGVAVHELVQPGTSVVLTEFGRWLRAYGGLPHPNELGGLLAVTILVTGYLFCAGKSKSGISNVKYQISNSASTLSFEHCNDHLEFEIWNLKFSSAWLLVPLALQVLALITTFSRSGWLALALGFAAWWMVERVNRLPLAAVTVMVAVTALFGAVVLWEPVAARLTAVGRLEQRSVDERVASAGESGSILQQVWWHGLGPGNYTFELEARQPGQRSFYYQPVPNVPLLALAELGLIGFLALALLLWYAVRAAYPLGLPFLAVLLPGAFLDHYWWTSASMLLLGTIVLVLASSQASGKPASSG